MAIDSETEALLVRFLGDNASYVKLLETTMATTQAAVSAIEKETARLAKQAESFAKEQSQHLEKVGTNVAKSSQMWSTLTNQVRQYTMAIVAAIGATSALDAVTNSIQFAAEAESTEAAFRTIIGSAKEANATLGELRKFADWSPFNTREVLESGKMMLAMGSSADALVKDMTLLGDVAAGLKIPIRDLSYLYGTLRSTGRATTVDINQFAMRGIGIWKQLETMLGMSNQQLRKFIETGGVTFEIVEQAFKNMTAEGGQFYNAMVEQSKTLSGIWSTFQSEMENTLTEVGKVIVENLDLKWLVGQVSEAVIGFKEWLKTVDPMAKRFAVFFAVILGGLVLIKLAVVGIGIAVTAATGGINLLLAAVVAGAAAVAGWAAYTGGLSEAWEKVVDNVEHLYGWLKPLFPLMAAVAVVMAPALGILGLVIYYWDDIVEAVKEFWNEVRPIATYLKEGFLTAMTVIRNDMVKGWETIVRTFQRAVAYIRGLWDDNVGHITIDWKSVKEGVFNALLFIEYAFNNIGKVADLAWAGIKYGAVALVNALVRNIFGVMAVVLFPAVLLSMFVDWKKIWTAVKDWMVEWGKKMWDFITSLFGKMLEAAGEMAAELKKAILNFELPNIPAIMQNIAAKMAEEWKKAQQAIGDVKIEGLGVKVEGLDKLEEQLKKEWEASKMNLTVGFEDWKKIRLAEIPLAPQEQARAEEQAKKSGKDIGAAFTGGFKEEMKKWEAVAFGSVEAIARMNEYTERLGKQTKAKYYEQAPMPREVPLKLFPDLPEWLLEMQREREIRNHHGRPPEDRIDMLTPRQNAPLQQDRDREAILGLLGRIAAATEEEAKKEGVTLKTADT
jgi:hypothetical protein